MSFKLSHSHGANLKSRPEIKIAAAGRRNAIFPGIFLFQWMPDFQRRHQQTPSRKSASGIKIPKFANQNWKMVGRPSSGSCITQPRFHSSMDAARKLSLIDQTKKVAGRNALAIRIAMCRRIGASPQRNKQTRTAERARKVCTWNSGIDV